MKLFLIIYAGSQIGGIAGPLPYGMDECLKRRDALRTSHAEVLDTGYSEAQKRKLTEVEMSRMREMRFECEWRGLRPSLDA
ncbi:hypothetical protein [Shinella sp.]|uniref:hypothetical protein n=1 Tax=Shinella sp. TaxID=1870904 RepID=UPI003F6F2DA0